MNSCIKESAYAFCVMIAKSIKESQIKKKELKEYLNRVIDDMYKEFG